MEQRQQKTSKPKNRRSSAGGGFERRFSPLLKQIEMTLDRFSSQWLAEGPGHQKLVESVRYSLLSGGKRFRPLLTCLVSQALKGSVLDALPWAAVVEFIHAYSLIHDDLPCMDNDDLRRGQPTNHKVYGEAMALLAGDALLTEAFGRIAASYIESPQMAVRLVSLLVEAAGVRGMVGGQALDVWPEKLHGTAFLQNLHDMKTGALIRVACEGAAVIADGSLEQQETARTFGGKLGFAFQLMDDLLDYNVAEPEAVNLVNILGVTGARQLLNQTTDEIMKLLEQFPEPEDLIYLVQFNRDRDR